MSNQRPILYFSKKSSLCFLVTKIPNITRAEKLFQMEPLGLRGFKNEQPQ